MVSIGQPTISRANILEQVSEADILGYYLNITEIPILIHSPLRRDDNPSFYLYSPNGSDVNYIDFSSNDRGGCMSLLMHIWNCSRSQVYTKIQDDLLKFHKVNCIQSTKSQMVTIHSHGDVELQCKIREWRQYDIEYWESYGITLPWLKWCEVYPISHKIITKSGKTMIFGADKYAYTFVERKEGKITHKFYQPFNRKGYKWQNSHDKSVLGLWSKMPETGKAVCICSSVKDALCLMSNLKIPCICLQGEGYPISDTAMYELRRRFKDIYICLDNDKAGLEDASKLASKHALINVVIPQYIEGKDISDVYKNLNNKKAFIELFTKLITEARYNYYNELPF